MKSQQQLTAIQQQAFTALSVLVSIVERHTATAAALEADDSRSDKWKADTLREMRGQALERMGEAHSALRTLAAEAKAARRFWGNSELLLSRQRFSSDPGVDAAMRSARLNEYSRLGSEALSLIAEVARGESDWSTYWLASLANRAHKDAPGHVAIPLDIELPEQRAALATLDETERHLARADLLAAEVSGRSPYQRLEIASRIGHHPREPAAA